MKHLQDYFSTSIWWLLSLLMLIVSIIALGYFILASGLPDVSSLKKVQYQVPVRVFTRDGLLIAEYGEKRRIPVTYDEIPKPLIQAILATEDQRFFEHIGVDYFGLLRAGKNLVQTGSKGQGGSTITMQVARNFFLSPEKTYIRKLKELMLAIKIERELSKEQILELYFNKIFFGFQAYGVAAAASVYFGKSLNELTLGEMALLAGLPKAPSTINPIINPKGAVVRRDHVLKRMMTLGYIDNTQYEKAIQEPLIAKYHGRQVEFKAPYVSEMVRASLEQLGGDDIFTKGLKIYTSIDSQMEKAAEDSVQKGLLSFEWRHGYRGPENHWDLNDPETPWQKNLETLYPIGNLLPAVVTKVSYDHVDATLEEGKTIVIPWEGLVWARKEKEDFDWSPTPKKASDILQPGDVIRVIKEKANWKLAQIPQIEGALVAIDPHDGRVVALVGGFDYQKSNYNRAVQASRQPGSGLKPFIYAAALEKGYTLASVVNDAPIVIESSDSVWRPQNSNGEFNGPTRLRMALVRSRNMVSIRVLQDIGIQYALDYLKKFGFDTNKFPIGLSIALGTPVVTPLEITRAYAVFANGGYLIRPYLIDRIVDMHGKIIYQAAPKISCETCLIGPSSESLDSNIYAEHTVSSDTSYLITSALQDVIKRGTGQAALSLHRDDLAGKTGTTNDQYDAWFLGFNHSLVSSVWVGFDHPKSLSEYGAQAALPIWTEFMGAALKNTKNSEIPRPSNIISVRIDPDSGLLARADQPNAEIELFKEGEAPKEIAPLSQPEGPNPQENPGTEPIY